MTARAETPPRRVLLLAAHPNDEFALAATLRAHVAAGDDVWAAWFAVDDRSDIQDRRRAEAIEAMALIGVPDRHLIFTELPPLALALQLGALTHALQTVADGIEPELTYVPAYEGGHPDHDALSFSAWESAIHLGELREYPMYRKAEGRRLLRGVPRFARMLPGVAQPDLRWLDPEEVAFKREVWKVYKSQRPLFDVLLRMSGDEHRFFSTEQTRPLPLRDYTKPPHEPPLLYEQRNEGVFSFEEFAHAVRRYHWTGGIDEDPL